MTESTTVGTRGFNTEKCRRYSSSRILSPNMQAKGLDYKTGSFLPPVVTRTCNHESNMVALYKKVRKVVLTSSIPKSAVGNVLRRELKK